MRAVRFPAASTSTFVYQLDRGNRKWDGDIKSNPSQTDHRNWGWMGKYNYRPTGIAFITGLVSEMRGAWNALRAVRNKKHPQRGRTSGRKLEGINFTHFRRKIYLHTSPLVIHLAILFRSGPSLCAQLMRWRLSVRSCHNRKGNQTLSQCHSSVSMLHVKWTFLDPTMPPACDATLLQC